MIINISNTAQQLGEAAAAFVAGKIKETVMKKGEVRMVVSTGSSQFEFFQALLKSDVDWTNVEVFHLDEYIGLPVSHPASFRKYLNERFVSHINLRHFHSVDVEGNIEQEIKHLTTELRKKAVDIGVIGIGVNGHIAFNDPPADFDSREAYIVVKLDDKCKMQQVDEGWFGSIDKVPSEAVSMTPWQIMQCETIVSCVPHKVKAESIRNTLINKLTEIVPATILKQHGDFHLFLDKDSASEIIPW